MIVDGNIFTLFVLHNAYIIYYILPIILPSFVNWLVLNLLKLLFWNFENISQEAVSWGCSVRKRAYRNFSKFTGKYLSQSIFFNKVPGLRFATLLKKETLAQVFSCEFREISKNTFSHKTSGVVASTSISG